MRKSQERNKVRLSDKEEKYPKIKIKTFVIWKTNLYFVEKTRVKFIQNMSHTKIKSFYMLMLEVIAISLVDDWIRENCLGNYGKFLNVCGAFFLSLAPTNSQFCFRFFSLLLKIFLVIWYNMKNMRENAFLLCIWKVYWIYFLLTQQFDGIFWWFILHFHLGIFFFTFESFCVLFFLAPTSRI